MSSSVGRTWVLTATAPGKYTIGPARAKDIVFTWRLVLNGETGANHDASFAAAHTLAD